MSLDHRFGHPNHQFSITDKEQAGQLLVAIVDMGSAVSALLVVCLNKRHPRVAQTMVKAGNWFGELLAAEIDISIQRTKIDQKTGST